MLWLPFQGPVAFDIPRDAPSVVLAQTLSAAGHDAAMHQLIVAFDSQASTVDLLSVPHGHSIWWIVRDGLSRELLRPVAPWYHDRTIRVVTVNAHGQARGVIYSAEVASLKRLPQGARGMMSEPLTNVIGHLTASGLAITEIAIGTVTGSAVVQRSLLLPLLLLLSAGGASAMQPAHSGELSVAVPDSAPPWSECEAPSPTCTRVWTHTLAAPIVIPYDPRPNPARITQAVAGTGRGVMAPGELAWATPQVVHGCAHILHFPAGNVPRALYWLLHYCGRAVVVGVHPGPMDWPNLGQQAFDAFGVDCFIRGHFGIQLSNKIVRYGQSLHTPPHGAIVHLVKVPPIPPAHSQGWDPPPDPAPLPSFEYDICMGPRGEVPLPRLQGEAVPRGSLTPAARRPAPVERPTDVSQLAKQVESVASQLLALTTRLEGAGVLQAPSASTDSAAPVVSATPEPRAEDKSLASRSAASSAVMCLVLLRHPSAIGWSACLVSLLPSVLGDGETESSADSPVPASPSEPDLTDLSAPTPSDAYPTSTGA